MSGRNQMVCNSDLLQLAKLTSAVFVNAHDVPFTLHVSFIKNEDKSCTFHVLVRCKRYRESPDCIGTGECVDFCKCNWEEHFHVDGKSGQTIDKVIRQTIARADGLCWCTSCSSLAPLTTERLCFTCAINPLLTKQPEDCCICLESQRTSIALACGHTLCFYCARRLIDSVGALKCPCCRRPLSRSQLSTCIPPNIINSCRLPRVRSACVPRIEGASQVRWAC